MDDLTPVMRCDRSGTCLVFDLRRGDAEPVHIGGPLPADENLIDLADARRRGPRGSQPDRPALRSILPQTGWGYAGAPALVLQRDGLLLMARLVLDSATSSDHGLRLSFGDQAYGLRVDTHWRIAESGLVVTEVALTNHGDDPIGLLGLASLALPLPDWASHATRYAGRWAGEMQQTRLPLAQGSIGTASYGGRPGFGGGQWVRIESADLGEHHGHAIAAHLAWSGDHQLTIEHDADGAARLMMAARLDPGEVMLAPGEVWTTPRAFFAASDQGIAPARHAFHRHALTETVPAIATDTARKVHLNSWEALAFDMDQPRLMALASDAAALGVERFVLDDGWFTGRRDDTTSLGDWTPDAGIFPDGLTPLIDHVRRLGMDFGLWVEPEMVSPDSDLYRAHPDWCLHLPGQPRPTQRNQLVLDLTLPAVTDCLFERLDALLSGNAIAYLKWDHNRELFPQAGKGHAQVKALYALLDRLREAHPQVEIETCASGGGRVDFEILKRCTRYWASDNNDAVERLRINDGWVDFLPLRLTGSHVGPSPNPITGRRLPMDFRAKVAMFGHMGVEANPAAMTEADGETLAAHIALYKQWRDVIHGGTLTRIATGQDGLYGWFAWDGSQGLALVAQTRQSDDYAAAPVRLTGLDPSGRYLIKLLDPWPARAARHLALPDRYREGLVLSGKSLAETGLALPLSQPETAWLVSVNVA